VSATSALDRDTGVAETVDVALDRSNRHAGLFGESCRRRRFRRMMAESFNDCVLSFDEGDRLVKLDVSG